MKLQKHPTLNNQPKKHDPPTNKVLPQQPSFLKLMYFVVGKVWNSLIKSLLCDAY